MRQGVRCGRVAVVCRDISKYRAAVKYEFRMADIPLYCDEPTTPEFSAPATAVRCLLAIARGAELTEQLTTLAKTGLCALTEEEVCALENYAYTWSPNAAAWRAPFEKNPRGFGDVEPTDEDRENLARAEKARALLITAADGLRGKLRSANAEQMSRALYFCLKELGAEDAQAAQVEAIRAERGIPAAEEAAREWNVVMGLLDEMASLLGGQSVTIPEYEELFGLLLRSSDLGHIPQTLDAVVLASAGKMRLDAPDYVFVLGLSEGEFPAAPGETGLLTHADRDALMAQEIELPDCFENRVVREQVCFYKALTAPAKGLWLSWPKGQGQTLCAALEPIVDVLRPGAPELDLTDLAATAADGLDVLGGGWPLTETERAFMPPAGRNPRASLSCAGWRAAAPVRSATSRRWKRCWAGGSASRPVSSKNTTPAGTAISCSTCWGCAPGSGPSFPPTRAAPSCTGCSRWPSTPTPALTTPVQAYSPSSTSTTRPWRRWPGFS